MEVFTVRKRKLREPEIFWWAGILHRYIVLGGKKRLQIKLGAGWRTCLNEQLPTNGNGYVAHPQDGQCRKCGYIYSHLMRGANQPCDECRIEREEQYASALRRWLGVDGPYCDPIAEREANDFCEAINFGMSNAW